MRPEAVDSPRIDRLAAWLAAVDGHDIGTPDAAWSLVRGWSGETLRVLQTDATTVLMLVADPRLTTFRSEVRGRGVQFEIGYTRAQLARLRLFACAAAGTPTDPRCRPILACLADAATDPGCDAMVASGPTDAVVRLMMHATAARSRGDRNYLPWRAALLHTDAVTLGRQLPAAAGPSPGPLAVRLEDGRITGRADVYEHWDLSASMLDHIVVPGDDRPAPGRDSTVRDWYVATIAWMEGRGQHSIEQTRHALGLFPADPDVLFLSGCQHEAYAAPDIQEALKGLPTPRGLTRAVQGTTPELREAEQLLRRALAAKPDMQQARLHLGHVLLRLGLFDEAAGQLEQARAALDDPTLRYYAELFLGSAREERGQFDLAEEAYGRASMLYPAAQSPDVARSELSARRGRVDAALAALDRMFALPVDDRRNDPWWLYYVSDVPNPDLLLDRFRARFTREPAS